jgi:peptidoglycan/xylan/chitin deacetylase (PgdA/CDA1 family)
VTLSRQQLFATGDAGGMMPARDLVGYGPRPPKVLWPGEARLALQLVVNYEEGSERSFPMGDGVNEGFHEFPEVLVGQRDLDVESVYEYGGRAGIWRLVRVLDEVGVPVTFFATVVALARNPALVDEIVRRGDEVASHGYRWIEHYEMDADLEREWIGRSYDALTDLIGTPPVGWYCRQMSVNTRRLLVEHGGFLYDSDAYNDDLPYWTAVGGVPHLVVPYTLTMNDAHYVLSPTFGSPEDFYAYGKATIDRLCREDDGVNRMMSIGLHARIAGHPARADALARLIEYALGRGDVWIARRRDIAMSFAAQVPPTTLAR